MGVAILGRFLYVVGGNSSHQEVLKSVERYSFDDEKWSNVAPMSVPRASPAVSSVDGLLYVAGGDQVICVHQDNRKLLLISLNSDSRGEFLSSTNHDQLF